MVILGTIVAQVRLSKADYELRDPTKEANYSTKRLIARLLELYEYERHGTVSW